MKQDKIYTEVENICRRERIMEMHYGVEMFIIDTDTHYFTSSQEADIWDMIRDGLEVDEIVSIIKQW